MSGKEQNPSTGDGVFEGIRGAKSRDPEVEAEAQEGAAQASEEPKEQAGQPEPEATAPVAESGGDKESDVRARQRIAQLERRLAEMGPWAQIGIALRNDPNGEALLGRLQRGEPLLAGDPSEAQIAQAAGMSKEELIQTLNERDAIKRQIDEITEMAKERLPNYAKIQKNPQFLGMMDAAMAAVWNGSVPIHEDVKEWQDEQAAKNYTALAFAHEMYLMRNPKVREAVKKAGANEERDRAGAALAATLSSGSTTSAEDGDRKLTPEEAVKQRMLNARGVGKSFAKAF